MLNRIGVQEIIPVANVGGEGDCAGWIQWPVKWLPLTHLGEKEVVVVRCPDHVFAVCLLVGHHESHETAVSGHENLGLVLIGVQHALDNLGECQLTLAA